MQVISRDARARLSPIIDVKVMTAASARFAAPWGHHSGPMLRQDLHKVQWKPVSIHVHLAQSFLMVHGQQGIVVMEMEGAMDTLVSLLEILPHRT